VQSSATLEQARERALEFFLRNDPEGLAC